MKSSHVDDRRIAVILTAVHRHHDVAWSHQLKTLRFVKPGRGDMKPAAPEAFKTVPAERIPGGGDRQPRRNGFDSTPVRGNDCGTRAALFLSDLEVAPLLPVAA